MELIAMHSTAMPGAVLAVAMIAVYAYAADEVREIHNPLGFATSMTNANNGDLLLMRGNKRIRISGGGETVGEVEKMPMGISGVTRLDDQYLICRTGMKFFISADDGTTWEKRGEIDKEAISGGEGAFPGWIGLGVPNYDVLIRANDGRLFLPVRGCAAASEVLARQLAASAIIEGTHANVEGHAHRPEADYSFCYFSEDEGRTWKKSEGTIIIWKDNGFGGMWPADEPCMIDLPDGELRMFFRTTLGRIYTSRSGPVDVELRGGAWSPEKRQHISAPAGVYWDIPLPTDLAAAYTPCRVRRIPSTGDLLLVWNQVSSDEIRGSYSRCRLSTAISRDQGQTWTHFRTIDRAVIAPAGRVAPDPEPSMARALNFVGEIPGDWAHLDYPNLGFFEDKVAISWTRATKQPLPGQARGPRLLIAPVSWLYEDDDAYTAPAGSPKLVIGNPGREVDATWIDDRFLVNLTDIAAAFGRDAPHNMVCTLRQAVTALEVEALYDESQMDDANDPMMRVIEKE